jgi:uncharacterized protein
VLGTLLNTAAILTGGIVGLTVARDLSERVQVRLKLILGVLVLLLGFKMTWDGLHGSFGQVTLQLLIAFLALILGNILGKIFRLQKAVTRLGEWAKARFQNSPEGSSRFGDGLVTATILFCVGPMAILGALEDGLQGRIRTLAIKSVMDGLTTAVFVRTFGWSVILSALPVLAYQGTITLAAQSIGAYVQNPMLIESMNATGGLLLLCVAVVVLDLAKAPLADYLPSLAVAPGLTWLLR